MTTIVNEMICGTVDSTTGSIRLTGDIKVSKEGVLMSINSGMVYATAGNNTEDVYLGSYNVSVDSMDPSSDKRSISINIVDISKMNLVSTAITTCLSDIATKYTPAD